jgi:hypothetical protein
MTADTRDYVLASLDPPSVWNFYPSMEAAAAVADEANAYNVKLEAHGAPKRTYSAMTYEEYKAKERELYLSRPEEQIPEPMWGQTGSFTINIDGMPIRIEQDGIFGTGTLHMTWPPFGAHAVDYQKPFISETGYRCFIGVHADMVSGITPDDFAREMIRAYMQRECKGKPKKIERSYVGREMERRTIPPDPSAPAYK